MRKPRVGIAVLVVVLLLGGASAVAVYPATAADARLTLTDATVTPDTPAAGAPITVSTTVQLSAGSDTPLAVDSVRVVGADETLGEATDLGTLSPGETLSVPVTFTVDEAKVHDLELVVTGTDEDDETTRATRPLTVGVEVGAPQFEIGADQLVAGAEREVAVAVANPTTAPLRGIELRLTNPASGDQERRTIPTLAPGATQTVNLTALGPQPGEVELAIETTYTDPTGAERTATHARTVEVTPLSVDVGVRAERPTTADTQQVPDGLGGLVGGGGALQSQSEDEEESAERVDVTVTNFGNAPVGDVVLTGRTDDGATLASVGRFAVTDRLGAGDSETVTVDLSRVRGVDGLRFVASYKTPEGRSESALVFNYSAAQGAVSVTGLDVTVDEEETVTLAGNLANTGDGEITSAVVAVEPSEYVDPAYPQRTYFVGTVAASEFAPFDLTARADTENATAVTLRVTYTAGDERVTETVQAPLENRSSDESGGISQSMTLSLAALSGLVAVGAVVLFARRSFQR
jgi:hypothetical protein